MNQNTVIRRMGRRETHSSRSAPSTVTALLLFAAVLWLLLETALSFTGNPPLLLAPAELIQHAAVLGTATLPEALLAAGAASALLGILALGAAIMPGHKPRHVIENPRSAVVVERGVLASAIARTARTTSRLAPEQVTASVGHKGVEVRIHPTSGMAVDPVAVREAVESDVAGYSLARHLKVNVAVAPHAAVGL